MTGFQNEDAKLYALLSTGRISSAQPLAFRLNRNSSRFRLHQCGDTCPPEDIKSAGGFNPPNMRTDMAYEEVIAKEFYGYVNRAHGLNPDEAARAQWIQDVINFMHQIITPANRKLFAEYPF